jgi:undecaprenyl-diphosphatase
MDKFYPLVEDYGSVVVFFGVMLGCSGIPFPSAAILIAAGVLIQQGHLQLGFVIAFGILGAIIGNQIGYWAGLKGGRAFVLKWGRYVKITPERLEQIERLLARYGGKAVFASRFFSVTRVFGALVAGTSRMRFGTFLFSSVLSGVVWATAVVLVGYFFGPRRGIGRDGFPCSWSSYSPGRWESISHTSGLVEIKGCRVSLLDIVLVVDACDDRVVADLAAWKADRDRL